VKTLPAKCPITPNAAAQAIIDKHNLVYIGVGSGENPLLPTTVCGIGVNPSGRASLNLGHWNGSSENVYYFVVPDAAAKYFKARKVSKPETTYFTDLGRTFRWVVKLHNGVYRDYSNGISSRSTRIYSDCVRGIASGCYSLITRAEFLAAIKKFGLKEDGTKIAPPAPKIDHEAENVGLRASLAAATAAVPEGYRTACKTLPEQIKRMVEGLKVMSEDRKALREEVSKLEARLAQIEELAKQS